MREVVRQGFRQASAAPDRGTLLVPEPERDTGTGCPWRQLQFSFQTSLAEGAGGMAGRGEAATWEGVV